MPARAVRRLPQEPQVKFLILLAPWLLFLLALICSACVSPISHEFEPRYDGCIAFQVSPAFSVEERQALSRAVETWNGLAVKQFCLTDEPSPYHLDRVDYGGEEYHRLAQPIGKDFYGLYIGGQGRIVIVSPLGIELFEAVALHELGHALGLDHTPAPSIMHAAAGSAYQLTPIDIAECIRVGACVPGIREGE